MNPWKVVVPFVAVTLISLGVGCTAHVHVATRQPPADRVEVEGPSPGHDHIWIRGHWRWDGHEYDWVPGHWETRRGEWVHGHWEHVSGGWVWHEGHWR